MDNAGVWGNCKNVQARALLFVSTAEIDDIPQEIREAIHKKTSITYAGHAFGCIYHEGEGEG